jgi:hypothetical protein
VRNFDERQWGNSVSAVRLPDLPTESLDGPVKGVRHGDETNVLPRAVRAPPSFNGRAVRGCAVRGHVIPQGWPSRNSPWWDAAGSEGSGAGGRCQVVLVPGRFRGR